MPSSKSILLMVVWAVSMADAIAQPWEANEIDWLLGEPEARPSRDQRVRLTPEHFSGVQADGNFVVPRFQSGDELKLMAAIRANDVAAAQGLLKSGASPNAQDYWRDSPLLEAVRRDNLGMAMLLIDQGAVVNTKGRGYTALGLAAKNGNVQLVSFLLKAGANPDRKNDDGDTPLHSAVLMGYADTVVALVRAHPDMSLFNGEGLTPLALAASTAQYDSALALIRGGASLELGDKKLRPPLWWAFSVGDFDMARLLLKHGAKPGQLPVQALN